MKKYIILPLFALLAFCSRGFAQSDVFYGGNIGFNITSNYWMVNVSPLVGYNFTPSVAGGMGVIYQYYKYKINPGGYSINSYGISPFLRYDLSANLMKGMPFGIFFQADYEGTQNDYKYNDPGYSRDSEFINRLYLGAGYIQPISARARLYFIVSVDMLHLNDDGGVVPVIRGGITF